MQAQCDDEDEYEDQDSLRNMYLTFRLGEEDYGIETRHVTEIVGMQKITEVPDMPDFIRGVINLRGKVIPVMDVRLRFHMQARDYDQRTCVVVVHIDQTQIGLIVDTVNEVRTILPEQISPPPNVAGTTHHRYINGMGRIGEAVNILLDASKLLQDEERDALVEELPENLPT